MTLFAQGLNKSKDQYVINYVGLFSVSDWSLVGYSVFQEDPTVLIPLYINTSFCGLFKTRKHD